MSVKKTTLTAATKASVTPSKRVRAAGSTTVVMTVRLPTELLGMLDRLVEQKRFTSRSEAIREFCREYVQERLSILEELRAVAGGAAAAGGTAASRTTNRRASSRAGGHYA